MAYFAELDGDNKVKRVVVVGNDVVTTDGPLGENDMHVDGETWCVNFFKGGTWKQTSHNNNFRKQYAGKNYTYDAAKNKFISPKPHASWSLDGDDDWQAPVTYPSDTTDKRIVWNEAGQKWTATDLDENNSYDWDVSAQAWVST